MNKKQFVKILSFMMFVCFKVSADNMSSCGENCSWSFDETTHTLMISGTGDMKNYGPVGDHDILSAEEKAALLASRPWHNIASEVENVVVSGVTSIGARAFQRMDNLQNITISDSVTSVYRAFLAFDNSLTSITLPNSITSIEPHAFSSLYNLESINIPESVTYIGDKAFDAAKSLISMIIPDSVTSIGDDAFDRTTATIYCASSSPCAGKGSENIVPYERQGGVYILDGKFYTSLENMQKDISREAEDTNDYTCGTDKNKCKRDVLEAKGICQGSACDTFIQSDGNYMLKYNGKTYQSINDLLKGNYDKRRIYTIEEANFVAGDKNRVSIKYR